MNHTKRQPFVVAALVATSLVCGVSGRADTPAGVSEYLVPFDEDVFAYVTSRVTNATIDPASTSRASVDVTAWSAPVRVYYDHWENGYALDPVTLTGADEVYDLNVGQTLSFLSLTVPRPRTGADGNAYVGAAGNCTAQTPPGTPVSRSTPDYCYDGRDRFVTVGGATTVTRGGWLEATDIHAAVGEEVYPLAPQLIKYILPFGEDATRIDYERIVVVVQATEDDTTIQIDFNADGTFDSFNTENGYRTTRADPTDATSLTLQRGESYVLDRDSDGIGGTLDRGVVILGSKTLQVEYFYGDYGSTYNTRAVAAYPRGFWGNEYYAPVDGAAGFDTDVTLYNPEATTITIDWQTTAGSGTFTMAPNETAFFGAKTAGFVPDGSALHLKGSGAFWGISDISTNDSSYDWSYSLVPSYLLQTDQFVSYAPGNASTSGTSPRSSGIFVTPVQDRTTFFVDVNADGTPDTTLQVDRGTTTVTPTGSGYQANRLESLYITDNDGDMTGAHIWATGPFAMAYGENPQTGGASDGVDLGYTVLPAPADWMDLALTVDKTTSPTVVSTVSGATTVTYTLNVDSHLFNLTTLDVVDTLPANWTFVNNSATITFPNLSQLTGAAANPTVALPNLTWPAALLGTMQPNQRITITFQARTTAAFTSGALTQNNVRATGSRTVGSVTQSFRATDYVFNTYLNSAVNNMTVAKTSGAADPVSPGDTIPYTVTVSNPGTAALTGVSIFDTLPRGVTYVPGSGVVNCPATRTFLDTFGAVSYSNSNGSADWSANPWVETDAPGGGAASGQVSVTGGVLRLARTVNVQDQFGTAAYTNNDGTTSWNGGWTETDPSPASATGAGGGFVWITGGALQLRYLQPTVADDFANQDYSGNTGNTSWATNWTENNDDGVPTSGDIRIDGSERIEFRDTTDGGTSATGESIQRSANVVGATSVTVQFGWAHNLALTATNDNLVAEYSSNGGASWTTLRTLNGGVANATFTDVLVWNPANTMIILRFRAVSSLDTGTGKEARFDNVTISYNAPASSVGSQIVRSANLAGATSATLTFSFTRANLAAGDSVVVQASPDGTTFTTLETFTSATANGTKTYNLITPTSYATANTTIRFQVTGGFTTTETVTVDDVDITAGFPNPAVQRSANLAGSTSASLTFTPAFAGLAAGDTIVLEASSTSSGTFTTLATSTAGAAFTPAGPYNILPYATAAADTTIRFRITGGFGTSAKYFTVDDVTITAAATSFPALDPPTMLPATAGCSIVAGGTATLTFSVTVDNPFPAGETQVHNVATALANEIPLPISDDALNNVLNPSALSATVGDRIWLDNDGDGVLDLGEAGLAGVEVTLKDQWGTPLQVTTTDSMGRYSFAGVAPGTGYFVAVTGGVPSGLVQSTDSRTDNRTNSFDLTAGQTYLGADVGYEATAGTATIGDLVWSDADGDTIRDAGEPGLAGVTVLLLEDTNADGVGDALIATTVTGPDGSYLFAGITANGIRDYQAFVNVGQTALTNYNVTTPSFYNYTNVPAGASYVSADFGFRQKTTSPGTTYSITDRVWLDDGAGTGGIVADGVQNGTEAGIAGVTVALEDGSGNIIATTTTGANGNFQFTGVPAGANYRWRITDTAGVLSGFYATTPSAVIDEFQLPGNLAANVDYTATPHFGYAVTRAIGDTVFNDIDNSGAQNGSEPGIAGVTVLLYRDVDNDGVFEPGAADGAAIGSLVTDAAGKYLFSGLVDGNYWVNVDRTQSALSGYANLTTVDDSGVAGDQRLVALTGGASILTVDYGYRATTSYALSGRIWNDTNNNGVINSEPGIPGVTLEVLQGGTVIGTATTDASGNYSFPGLPQGGTYTVRITDGGGVLSGFTPTFEKTGGTAGPFDGQEVAASLSGNVTDLNFGFYRPQIPTLPVSLAWFRSTAGKGDVLLEWETSAEAGNLGFNVWGEVGSQKVKLNVELIPSQAVSALMTSSYSIRVPAGATRFWLEEVDLETRLRRHGPFELGRIAGAVDQAERVDWESVNRESEAKSLERVRNTLAGVRQIPDAGIRLVVDREGMYRVTYEELLAAGYNLAGVPPGNLVLTCRDRAVATWIGSNGATGKAFGPGMFLVFWGEPAAGLYTKENVYRLFLDPLGGRLAMETDFSAPDLAVTPVASYQETVRVDRNLGYSFSSPTGDPWYDTRIVAFTSSVMASFSLDVTDLAPGAEGLLKVGLWGSSDWPATPDHHVVVYWNGKPVANESFDGIKELPITAKLGRSQLHSGANQLEVILPGDSGVAYELVMLDTYSLTYPRLFKARENRLSFSSLPGQFAVEGMTSPDVYVFRRPVGLGEPVRVAGVSVEPSAGGYRARFPGTGLSLRASDRYQVATGAAFLSPRLEPGRPGVDLSGKAGAVAMLVIAHPDFVDGIAPLAAARTAQGIPTRVVDVESVYEEYSGGVVDPSAIKAMVREARDLWGIRSVLLVGGDTYDYQNALGLGSKSFVPTPYTQTDPVIVRYAPADALYGDLNDDGVPEVAVGRFPVRTSAELSLVVAKTLAWTGMENAVLAADQSDATLNFTALSNGLASALPAGLEVSKVYIDALGLAGARTALQSGMNGGSAFVGYLGHSSSNRWSFSNLFTTTDAMALTNAGRPLVVNQFGCWNNYFVEPAYNTLGHVLLVSGDRGAAATLGMATLSNIETEGLLGPILTRNLMVRGKSIGQALLEAKAEVETVAPGRPDVQAGMTLLGDPELVLIP